MKLLLSYKFVVQWKEAPKSMLMDSKLRCVFVEASTNATDRGYQSQASPVKTICYYSMHSCSVKG